MKPIEKKGERSMANERKLNDRWNDFTPSKTVWGWSMAGAAVATMILGFTAGGWTTGGTAQKMAEEAARDARAQLASTVCVERFTASDSARTSLAALKETASYKRDDFIADGGWATPAGFDSPIPGAADLCADQLAAMESLPVREIVETTTNG